MANRWQLLLRHLEALTELSGLPPASKRRSPEAIADCLPAGIGPTKFIRTGDFWKGIRTRRLYRSQRHHRHQFSMQTFQCGCHCPSIKQALAVSSAPPWPWRGGSSPTWQAVPDDTQIWFCMPIPTQSFHAKTWKSKYPDIRVMPVKRSKFRKKIRIPTLRWRHAIDNGVFSGPRSQQSMSRTSSQKVIIVFGLRTSGFTPACISCLSSEMH